MRVHDEKKYQKLPKSPQKTIGQGYNLLLAGLSLADRQACVKSLVIWKIKELPKKLFSQQSGDLHRNMQIHDFASPLRSGLPF
jgi:hypothetical protein